jgi:hypothetical protein
VSEDALPSFATLTKIVPDVSKKLVSKLKLLKNHFIKKCTPKLLFFNEKKIRKIWMVLEIENSLRKFNFCTLLRCGKAR